MKWLEIYKNFNIIIIQINKKTCTYLRKALYLNYKLYPKPLSKKGVFLSYRKVLKKFKTKGVKENYRTNYIKNVYKEKIYENIKIDLKNKKIILPKLKEVKIKKEGYKEKALENAMIHILLKKI